MCCTRCGSLACESTITQGMARTLPSHELLLSSLHPHVVLHPSLDEGVEHGGVTCHP